MARVIEAYLKGNIDPEEIERDQWATPVVERVRVAVTDFMLFKNPPDYTASGREGEQAEKELVAKIIDPDGQESEPIVLLKNNERDIGVEVPLQLFLEPIGQVHARERARSVEKAGESAFMITEQLRRNISFVVLGWETVAFGYIRPEDSETLAREGHVALVTSRQTIYMDGETYIALAEQVLKEALLSGREALQ